MARRPMGTTFVRAKLHEADSGSAPVHTEPEMMGHYTILWGGMHRIATWGTTVWCHPNVVLPLEGRARRKCLPHMEMSVLQWPTRVGHLATLHMSGSVRGGKRL